MSFTSNTIYVLAVLFLMLILASQAAKTKWGKQVGASLLVIVFTAVADLHNHHAIACNVYILLRLTFPSFYTSSKSGRGSSHISYEDILLTS